MKFEYFKGEKHWALIVPAVIASVNGTLVRDVDARIDTGADITVVPKRLLDALDVAPHGAVPVRNAQDYRFGQSYTYYLRIRVAGFDWVKIEVVETPKNYILLGRDWLNRFILHADGPAGVFELTAPRA